MQAGGGYQRSQNWSKALEAAKRSRNERFGPNQDWTHFLTQFFISFLTHCRARFSTRFSPRFFLFNFRPIFLAQFRTKYDYGMIFILPQKAFGGEFIHVISYVENFNLTTYSSN